MSDFDYGNARLHAMKSRLLSRQDLETLVKTGSLQGLISELSKSAYQKSIEIALTRFTGIACIDEAIHLDLASTIGKISGFYHEQPQKMVSIILRRYDIQNLKAIFRGLSSNVDSGEMIKALQPIGGLKISTLRELSRLRNSREVIDVLASMGMVYAHPLLALRAERPGAENFEMELALDQWHYQDAFRYLRSENLANNGLYSALSFDADFDNVINVLRFVHDPKERSGLQNQAGSDVINRLWVGPGRLPYRLLTLALNRNSVPGAVEVFVGTLFEEPLMNGLAVYRRTKRLSDIEKRLKRFRLNWDAGQIFKDPLGVGVILGYVALKINEISNIRWISQGFVLGLSQDVIRGELEILK